MKAFRFVRILALAALAAAPVVGQATERVAAPSDATFMKACVASFLESNFEGRSTSVNSQPRRLVMPLALNPSARVVKLSAVGAESGNTLASATCTLKDGSVTIAPATSDMRVAAR